MGRIAGKVAIITGGANGIGKTTVETLLREGASCVFTDNNVEAGQKTLNKFKQTYENVHFIQHDVQDETNWKQVVKETKDNFGRIDILFNNAGIFMSKPITDITLEEWNLLMGINVTGTFLGIKHVLPIMKEQESGSIINASSTAGISGTKNSSLYGASKGAVRKMAKDVAMEVAEYNVRVNSIHPGFISTPMGEQVTKSTGTQTEQIAAKTPLKRVGTPQDIANMVLFLASEESSYITAKEMVVDGGTIH